MILINDFISPTQESLSSYPDDGYHGSGGGGGDGGGSNGEPFLTLKIRLARQVSGFGFRIIGGSEEGSKVNS